MNHPSSSPSVPSGIRPDAHRYSDNAADLIDEDRTTRANEKRKQDAPDTPVSGPPATFEFDFESMANTGMFSRLERYRSLAVDELSEAIEDSDLGRSQGYEQRMLDSIAHVGYRYLQSGGVKVAQVLFEGLCAVRPQWAYVQLARGVCNERLGQSVEAWKAYEEAARLAPDDPQPKMNMAELAVALRKDGLAVRILEDILAMAATTSEQRKRAKAVLSVVQPLQDIR